MKEQGLQIAALEGNLAKLQQSASEEKLQTQHQIEALHQVGVRIHSVACMGLCPSLLAEGAPMLCTLHQSLYRMHNSDSMMPAKIYSSC